MLLGSKKPNNNGLLKNHLPRRSLQYGLVGVLMAVCLVLTSCDSKAKVQWESLDRSATQDKINSIGGTNDLATRYRDLTALLSEDERKPLNTIVGLIVDRSPSQADKTTTVTAVIQSVESMLAIPSARQTLQKTLEQFIEPTALFDFAVKGLFQGLNATEGDAKAKYGAMVEALGKAATVNKNLLTSVEQLLPPLKGEQVAVIAAAWLQLPTEATLQVEYLSTVMSLAPVASSAEMIKFINRSKDNAVLVELLTALKLIPSTDTQLAFLFKVQNALPDSSLKTFTNLIKVYVNTETNELTRSAVSEALKKSLVLDASLVPSFLTSVETNVPKSDAYILINAYVNSIDVTGGAGYFGQPQYSPKNIGTSMTPSCVLPGASLNTVTYSFQWQKSQATLVDWTPPSVTRSLSAGSAFEYETQAQCFVRVYLNGNQVSELATELVTVRKQPPAFTTGKTESFTLKKGESFTFKVADHDPIPSTYLNTFFKLSTQPRHGVTTQAEMGTFVYKPLSVFTGADSFSIVACNSDDMCTDEKIINMTVAAGNLKPRIERIIAPTNHMVDGKIWMNWGSPLSDIQLVIEDDELVMNCSGPYVTVRSSNTVLFPTNNVEVSGTFPYCQIKLTPTAKTTDVANVTLTIQLDDIRENNEGITTSTLDVVVAEPKPQWSASTPPSSFNINKGTSNNTILLTSATDPDGTRFGTTQALRYVITQAGGFSGTLSTPSAVPGAGTGTIVYTAPGGANTVANRTDTFTYKVCDQTATDPTSATASCTDNKTVTINIINNAPVISDIANQAINEGATTSALSFTIGDADDTRTCADVTRSSSNTALVANSGISVTGSGTTCAVTVTPVADANGGPVIVTLGLPHSSTVEKKFSVTINQVNDTPTVVLTGAVPAATTSATSSNLGTGSTFYRHQHSTLNLSEDAASASVTMVRGSDADTNSTLNVLPQSLTYQLVVAPTKGTLSSGNTIGVMDGLADPAGATNAVLTYVPHANQNGSDYFIYKVCDSSGSATNCTDNIYAPINIAAVPDTPSFSLIQSKTISEQAAPTATSIAFTITDVDNRFDCLASTGVTGVSAASNNQTLIPNANIIITGSARSCSVGVTPTADSNGGPVTITLSLSGTSVTQTFEVTILQVNNTPAVEVSGSSPLASSLASPGTFNSTSYRFEHATRTTNEDTAATFTLVKGSDKDTDSPKNAIPQTLSYHLVLAPNNGRLSSGNTVGVMDGISDPLTGASLTYTPNANYVGADQFIYRICDSSAAPSLTTCTENIYQPITVNAVNDTPSISVITNQTINEDTSTSSLSFTITDVDNRFDCTNNTGLTGITTTSSNTTLIPNSTNNIVVSRTSLRACTVQIIPATDTNGGPVTITVSLGSEASRTFTVNILQVNDRPAPTDIGSAFPVATSESGNEGGVAYSRRHNLLTLSEDTTASMTLVKGRDADTDSTKNSTTQQLSYHLVVAPTKGILRTSDTLSPMTLGVMNGLTDPTGASGATLSYVPNANQNGNDYFMYKICDSSGPPSTSTCTDNIYLRIYIESQPDSPTISEIANQTIAEDSTASGILFSITDPDDLYACLPAPGKTEVSITSSNTNLIPAANVLVSGAARDCALSVSPVANGNGGPVTITVSLAAAAARTFHVTVTPVNDTPSLSLMGANPVAVVSASNSGYTHEHAQLSTTEDTLSTLTLVRGVDVDASDSNSTTNGAQQQLFYVLVAAPTRGTLSAGNSLGLMNFSSEVDPLSGATLTYTPRPDENGDDSFIYKICDSFVPSACTGNVFVPVNIASVNDTPRYTNVATSVFSTDIGQPVSIALATATDADTSIGDSLTALPVAKLVSLPASGTVSSSSNGTPITDFNSQLPSTIVYTPAPGQYGTFSFSYRYCDTANACTEARTINITVTGKRFTTIADQTILEGSDTAILPFSMISFDSSYDCSASSGVTGITATSSHPAVIPTNSANITITGAARECSVRVTPAPNANGGPVTITLNIALSGGGTVTTSFKVSVTPVNDTPTVSTTGAVPTVSSLSSTTQIDDTDYKYEHEPRTIPEDSSGTFITLARGVDVDASDASSANSAPQDLFYFLVRPPGRGSLSTGGSVGYMNFSASVDPLNGATLTYTPRANENGSDYFIYKICDSFSPAACSDNIYMPLAITSVNDTPEFTGTAQSTFTTDVSTVDLAIALASARDIDADVGSSSSMEPVAKLVTLPAKGSLSGNPTVGSVINSPITYTPAAGHFGTYTFSYKWCDTDNACTEARVVSITVTGKRLSNLADQNISEGSPTDPLAFSLIDFDTAYDCIAGSGVTGVIATSSNTNLISNGNIVIAGSGRSCTVTVTPALNANGGPVTIELSVALSGGGTASTSFKVSVSSINDTPTVDTTGALPAVSSINEANYQFQHAVLTIAEDATPTNLTLVKGSDPDTVSTQNTAPQTLSYHLVVKPTKGTLSSGDTLGVMDGLADPLTGATLTYTPFANENGSDSFLYKICDSSAAPSASTCTDNIRAQISITAVNDTPTITSTGDTSARISESATVSITLATGSDVDGTAPTAELVSAPESGTISAASTSPGTALSSPLVYAPSNVPGIYTLVYRLCDANTTPACTANQTVTIEVVSKTPVFIGAATPATFNIAENAGATSIALDGAMDPDGILMNQTLSYTVSLANSLGSLGTPSAVSGSAAGSVSFTPTANTSGIEVLTYKVCDSATVPNCTGEKSITLFLGSANNPIEIVAGERSKSIGTATTATLTLGKFADPVSPNTTLEYVFTANAARISGASGLDPKSNLRDVTYTRPDLLADSEVVSYKVCTSAVTPQRCSQVISIEVTRGSGYTTPVLSGGDSLVFITETAGTGGGTVQIALASATSAPADASLRYEILQGPLTQSGKARADNVPIATLLFNSNPLASYPNTLTGSDARLSTNTLTYSLKTDVYTNATDQIVYRVCQTEPPALCSENRSVAVAVFASNDPTTVTITGLDPGTPTLQLTGAAQGSMTFALTFTLTDSDSTVACSNVVVESSNTSAIPVPAVGGGTSTSCSFNLVSATGTSGDANITLKLGTTALKLNATSEISFRATALALDASNKAIHVCDGSSANVAQRPAGVTNPVPGAAACKDFVAGGWDATAALNSTLLFRTIDNTKLPDPRRYCTGIKLFGYQGMAYCGMGSEPLNIHRTVGSLLLNAATAPSSDYRLIPNPSTDHDAQTVGTSGVQKLASRPTAACGSAGSVAARIAECATANPNNSHWDGSALGNSGYGLWRLVTVSAVSGGTAEVWRDERTGLLWSDVITDSNATPVTTYNWCKASGNSNALGAPSRENDATCGSAINQGQDTSGATMPTSLCAEDPAFLALDARQKLSRGDLDLTSAPAIRWWLPSRNDFMRAERHGLRFVLPNASNEFWTATVSSLNTAQAWTYDGSLGGKFFTAARNLVKHVRCVGSP